VEESTFTREATVSVHTISLKGELLFWLLKIQTTRDLLSSTNLVYIPNSLFDQLTEWGL
jgi:hypothetical protein